MKKFVNISNHPSSKWSPEQKQAVKALGDPDVLGTEIVDIPCPRLDPSAKSIAKEVTEVISKAVSESPSHALVAGPADFVYQIVKALTLKGVKCVTACSERNTVDLPDDTKKVSFDFVRFREIW